MRRVHTPWGVAGWRLVLYAAWFSGLVPYLLLLRALPSSARRKWFLLWLLAVGCWAFGSVSLLRCAMPWTSLAILQLLWSLAAGLLCAVAACLAAARGWFASTAPVTPAWGIHRVSWPAAFGCGALVYGIALTDVATVSMARRAFDWSSRQLLSPTVLLWALPGLVLGMVLGALWQRRLGVITGRVLTNFFIGIHLIAFGMGFVLTLLLWGYQALELPEHFHVFRGEWKAALASLILLFVPGFSYGYYVSVSSRIRSVFARTLVCLGLFLANFLHLACLTGDQALVYRAWAIDGERAPTPAAQRRSVRLWEHYLAVFPSTDERAQALWRIATTLARMGQDDEARAAYQRLAALPDDIPGQREIRYARAILASPPGLTHQARVEVPTVPVIGHEAYLTDAWRSALSFLHAARPELSPEEFLVKLRRLSLDQEQLSLPSLTNLFEVQGYGRLLGVGVSVQPLSLAEIRSILREGQPVLMQYQDEWWCLVGFDLQWNTVLYYDYGRETPRVRARHRRAEAQAMLAESAGGSRARLRRLRDQLIEEVIEGDVVQALADHQWLAATLAPLEEPVHAASAQPWLHFLLGELAFEAGDPVLASEHYASSLADQSTTGVLPYLHLARLSVETPTREIVVRRLPVLDLGQTWAAWVLQPGHATLLANAQADVDQRALESLPTPALERLAALQDVHDPLHRALMRRCYETLRTRYPDDASYLTALGEVYRRDEVFEPLAKTLRTLSALEPGEANHRFRLAKVLLTLERPSDAQAVLAGVADQAGQYSPTYVALAGKTARALGHYPKAVRLLRRALQKNLADPELRYELALALEGLGRHQQALAEWRWVEFASVDARHVSVARQRLAHE